MVVIFLFGFPVNKQVKAADIDGAAELKSSRFVKRKVLALYDSAQYKKIQFSPFHRFIEMPLNHMGLDLRYRDIRDGYPDIGELKNEYRGIVTWFTGPLAEPERFLGFMEEALNAGLHYVVFGDHGVPLTPANIERLNRLYQRLGLRFEDGFVSQTVGSRIEMRNDDMIGFEQPLDPVLPEYMIVSATGKDTDIHLQVTAPSEYLGRRSILVATGPAGGMVQPGYGLASLKVDGEEQQKWIIDPFLFFSKALAIERFPIPDVTTISGRRLYFSHVDGDGWNNVSRIDGYRQKGVTSAEVMLEKFIKPYPDLPVTVGVITGDCDVAIGGDSKAIDIVRRIFALPQVEVGSHTHTHPFEWSFYKNYNRKREERLIEQNAEDQTRTSSLYERTLEALTYKAGKLSPRERNRKFIAGGALEMPRAYLKNPFNLNQEIPQSLKIAESYAPPGKKARLLQWSGDTSPFEAAIRMSRKAGVLNLNGGDTRFDAHYPSICNVAPISRMVGKERQIYAVNSNENNYTDLWTKNFYGLSHLTETLKNTEWPRRLKGFNLYYHAYSAERAASLKAVRGLLDKARNGPYIPIPASHYAQIANDFFAVRLEKISPLAWRVHDRGALQTLRFDDADDLAIDWQKSRGVIGENRHGEALYAALDRKVEKVVIALRKRDDGAHSLPHLVESRWQIWNVARNGCHLSFEAQGFGPGEMVWNGISHNRFELAVHRGDQKLFTTRIESGTGSPLHLSIPVTAQEPVEIEIGCQERASFLPPQLLDREVR